MPPKRTVTLGQDSPPFADSDFLFLSRETTNRHASGLAASSVGAALALAQACGDACDRLLYVSAHISAQCGQQAEAPQSVFAHWRSAEAWYRDDPSVTRRPLGQPVYVSIARTSPRRDVTVVSLGSFYRPPGPVGVTSLPGEAESALQACNRRGIPRPTAHQRCQAPEATLSGAVFFARPPNHLSCLANGLQAAGFRAFFLISFDRHSTSLAPAGISPRSRYFHNAMNSLRASATMPIFRATPLPVPNRRAYH